MELGARKNVLQRRQRKTLRRNPRLLRPSPPPTANIRHQPIEKKKKKTNKRFHSLELPFPEIFHPKLNPPSNVEEEVAIATAENNFEDIQKKRTPIRTSSGPTIPLSYSQQPIYLEPLIQGPLESDELLFPDQERDDKEDQGRNIVKIMQLARGNPIRPLREPTARESAENIAKEFSRVVKTWELTPDVAQGRSDDGSSGSSSREPRYNVQCYPSQGRYVNG